MIPAYPINRRNFLRYSGGTLSILAFNKTSLAQSELKKYKMGLQLFTVRDAMARDLTGTIKIIHSIGYEDLETYGFDPVNIQYYGLKASEFKQLMSDHALITTSGHYDFHLYFDKPIDALKKYADQCAEGTKDSWSTIHYLALARPEFQDIGEI